MDNSERNRPLGRPKCSREQNIKMDVKYIDWENMEKSFLGQDREDGRAVRNT